MIFGYYTLIQVSSGLPWDILNVIEQKMSASTTALSITALLWLDSVRTTNIDEVKKVLGGVSALISRFPTHTLSIGHVLYAPAFRQRFPFIHELNDLILKQITAMGAQFMG